ncbi:MAG: hypothetical protein IKA23_00290 [Akkermansia sp.]|nr:hypothetical protein [Akkermansia sp.]
MQSIISTSAPVMQQLTHEWYGNPVAAPVEFSFCIEGDCLVFRAAQSAPVTIHPEAQPGVFTEALWKYDMAEFFVSDAEGRNYMEFNICPNGAWWACAFSGPRQPLAGVAAPAGVETTGTVTPGGWACSARVPLSCFERVGIGIRNCRLAATCILNSPDYQFCTTSDDLSGEPDFHRPWSWAAARIQ